MIPGLGRGDPLQVVLIRPPESDRHLLHAGGEQQDGPFGGLQPHYWPHRAFGIVLVGRGISEIDENSIATVGGDETAVAFHRLQRFALVGKLQVAKILRLHLFGQLRVSDQIAEYDRQISPLQSN